MKQVVNPQQQTPQGHLAAKVEIPPQNILEESIKQSEGNMFNPIFKEKLKGRNIQGGELMI